MEKKDLFPDIWECIANRSTTIPTDRYELLIAELMQFTYRKRPEYSDEIRADIVSEALKKAIILAQNGKVKSNFLTTCQYQIRDVLKKPQYQSGSVKPVSFEENKRHLAQILHDQGETNKLVPIMYEGIRKLFNFRERRILYLHYWEDKPLVEIAEMLGEKPNTTTQHHRRMLLRLKEFITESIKDPSLKP